MAEPIVLQLQADCLDAGVPISTLLRKARLIASKLNLSDISQWIDSELNGYDGALIDLPSYRIGLGMPKFFNPYHGWLDIVLADQKTNKLVSTGYLPQSIGEIEHLLDSSANGFIILGFPPPIDEFLHQNLDVPFKCGLHLSTAVLVGVLEGIKNGVLEWTLRLEREGIKGEGLSFSRTEIERAQMVTNHIYGGNIGVLGNVSGNANNSRFVNSSGVDRDALKAFVDQAIPASNGLDATMQAKVLPLLNNLQSEAADENAKPSRVKEIIGSLQKILEGASGNLVASAILTALGVHAG